MSNLPKQIAAVLVILLAFVPRPSLRAELALIRVRGESMISPDNRLGLAAEHSDGDEPGDDRLWLVHLPSMTPVGKPVATGPFLGMRGGAVWNLRAHRVAVSSGGLPERETKVFEYSSDSFCELAPLPDMRLLVSRYFSSVTEFSHKFYVDAQRWQDNNSLEVTVDADATFKGGKGDWIGLRVVVKLNKKKQWRTVYVASET